MRTEELREERRLLPLNFILRGLLAHTSTGDGDTVSEVHTIIKKIEQSMDAEVQVA